MTTPTTRSTSTGPAPATPIPPGQVLIFDADDTLWEMNLLFERVIEDYLDWLEHPTLDRTEIRRILDDIEAANAVTHGTAARCSCAASASAWSTCAPGPRPHGSVPRSTSSRWP
ncbi:hypothetical protein ACWDWO_03750 [Actinopolymorpha singaporensis]